MGLFETGTVMNEKAFRELRRYLLTPGQKTVGIAAMVCSGCMAFAAVIVGSYIPALVFGLLLLVLAMEYHFILNRNVKVNAKRLRETVGGGECRYTTAFDETGITVINHSTNGTTTIGYENLSRLVETQSYYALFTKAHQFILVNKETIDSSGQREALTAHIMERCPQIRWINRRK